MSSGCGRFEPGKNNEDVDAWVGRGMEGPAPATFFGAVKSIPSGTSVFLELDLQAGTTYTVQEFDNRLRDDFCSVMSLGLSSGRI